MSRDEVLRMAARHLKADPALIANFFKHLGLSRWSVRRRNGAGYDEVSSYAFSEGQAMENVRGVKSNRHQWTTRAEEIKPGICSTEGEL